MKAKKILASAISVLVMGGAMPAVQLSAPVMTSFAEEEEFTEVIEGALTFNVYSDHAEVAHCDEAADGEITIPAEVNDVPVTEIGSYAFENNWRISSVTIPDSVTRIQVAAFFCSWIETINIPDSVTEIMDLAFNSSHLKSISIPVSVKNIGGGAFTGTPWLSDRRAEDSLVIINGILIDGQKCSGDVVVPDTVTTISGGSALNSSSFANSQLTSVVLLDSVKNIDILAFDGCEKLSSVTILNPDCQIYDSPLTINNGHDENGDSRFTGVIRGYEGSTAQAYAEKYGYAFEPIHELIGKGSQSDPYQLSTLEDYQAFVSIVNSGEAPSACAVMTADISGVTEMVGTLDHAYQGDHDWLGNYYSGTFDGGGHILDVQISGNNGYEAPFCNVNGATIRNLTVTGEVTGSIHCSGLVGLLWNGSVDLIENCVVSAKITTTSSHCGGFVGHGYESTTTVRNCLFNGELADASSCAGAIYGWAHGSGTHILENCLENGTYTNCKSVDPMFKCTGSPVSVINSYWYAPSGNSGQPVGDMTAQELAAALGSGWTVKDGSVVPVVLEDVPLLGDLDFDKIIDASDASAVLVEYAATQTGAAPSVDPAIADVNSDSFVDASDASSILQYFAYTQTGGQLSFPEFLSSN